MAVSKIKLTLSSATVVNPDLSSSVVVGVSCALLVFVFAIQPLGTSKIACTFAPIVIVWMCFNFTFGVYVSIHLTFDVYIMLIKFYHSIEPGDVRLLSFQSLLALLRRCLPSPKQESRMVVSRWYLTFLYWSRDSVRRSGGIQSQVRTTQIHG